MENEQLNSENEKCWLSCITPLQKVQNVTFDTECKIFSPGPEKFFQNKFFTELQHNNTLCGELLLYITLYNYDIKKPNHIYASTS